MTEADVDQFARAWGGAWDQYGRNQTSAGITLAFRALKDLPIEAVLGALHAHIREQPKEPPTAGAIRQRINGDPDSRVHLAWAKFRRAMQKAGPYRSVAFDDPIIHAVVRDLGGWIACSDWTADELPFREQDFRRGYRAYIGQQEFPHPPYLAGISECHNDANGYGVEPPMLIGDPQAATEVMAAGRRERLVHEADEQAQQMALDIRRRRPRPPLEDLQKVLTGGGES